MRTKAPPLLNFTIAIGLIIGLIAIDAKQYQQQMPQDQHDTIAQACNGWFPGRGILRGIQAMRYNRAQRVSGRMEQYQQPAYGVQRVGYYSSSQPASYGSGGSQQYQVSYYVPNTTATYSTASPGYGSSGGGGNDASSVVIDESYDYPQTETVIEETIVEEPAAEATTQQPTAEQPADVAADSFWSDMQKDNPHVSEGAKDLIRAVMQADRKVKGERPQLEGELLKSPIADETASASPQSTPTAKPKTVVRKTIRRVQPQQRATAQAPPIWFDSTPAPVYSNQCPGGVCPLQPTFRF